MKLLITGGSGTLGKKITKLALSKNYKVNILSRNKNLISNNINLKYFYWDPNLKLINSECFVGVDSVINLAGFSIFINWSKKNKSKILNSRLNSTSFILNHIYNQKIKIRSFISASGISAYENSLINISNEKHSINDTNSFINQVVIKWEDKASEFQFKLPDISFSTMRIGLVLSKSGGLFKICSLLSRFYILSPLGKGNQWQSWIHEEDVANIFISSSEKSRKGIFNLVSPNPVRQIELINKIASINKSKVIFPNIPSFFVKKIFGEMSEIILSSQNVESIYLNDYKFIYDKLDDALLDLSI